MSAPFHASLRACPAVHSTGCTLELGFRGAEYLSFCLGEFILVNAMRYVEKRRAKIWGVGRQPGLLRVAFQEETQRQSLTYQSSDIYFGNKKFYRLPSGSPTTCMTGSQHFVSPYPPRVACAVQPR